MAVQYGINKYTTSARVAGNAFGVQLYVMTTMSALAVLTAIRHDDYVSPGCTHIATTA